MCVTKSDTQKVLMSADLSRDPGDNVGIFVKVICWPNYLPKDISLSQVIAEKLVGAICPLRSNRFSQSPGLIGLRRGGC